MILELDTKTYLAGALQALNTAGGMTAVRQLQDERDRQLYVFAYRDALLGVALTLALDVDLGECPCPLPSPAQRLTAEQVISLTQRELEIGRLLLVGMSRKEIARELVLSPETVKTHTTKLYRKLSVHRCGELRAHRGLFEQVAAIPPAGATRHG